MSFLSKKIFSPFNIILLTAFLDILGMSLLNPILPTIVRDFLTPTLISNDVFTHTLIQWFGTISPDPISLANGIAFSVFSIGMFMGGFIFGRLSDTFGRKKMLVLTTFLGTIGYITFGFAPTFAIFLLGRFISGLAGSGMGVAQAYIADIFPPTERAAKMGMVGAAFGIAFAVGPTIGGLLSHLGLQAVGFFSAIITFLNFLLAIFILPEPKHHAVEMDRADLPPIDYQKIIPIFIVSFLATFGFSAMQSTFGLIIPDRFGKTAEVVGYLMGVIGITSIIYQGFLIKHMRKIFLEKGMILFGLATMCFAFAAFAANPYFILVPFLQIFFPIGFGSLNASTSALLSKSAPGHTGKILGLNSSATSLASVFWPLLASGIYGISLVSSSSSFSGILDLPGFVTFMASALLFAVSFPFAYFAIRGHTIWTPHHKKSHSDAV